MQGVPCGRSNPCRGLESFTVDGLPEKLREFFRKKVREEGRSVAELTSTLARKNHTRAKK